jgi:phosphatidylserine/phosphatidylglycerophosphate/cardiolipin synthase-like enzyme
MTVKETYRISLWWVLIFFFPGPWGAAAGIVVQNCFSPERKCSDYILKEISRAQKEILVAVYAFTSDDIAWALIKAHQRGVRVLVLLDKAFDKENENSKGSLLERQGLLIRRISGFAAGTVERGVGTMHQKFAVIDRSAILTGSYNWTVAAEKYNHENLLYFRDAGALAEEYRREFFRLWEKRLLGG